MIIQDTMQSQIKILFYHSYIFFLKKGAISLSLWKNFTNKRLGNQADFEIPDAKMFQFSMDIQINIQ